MHTLWPQASIKLAVTGLMLAATIGCSASKTEPDTNAAISSADTTTASEIAETRSDKPADPAVAPSTDPATTGTPPQNTAGEPGYIGYPSMGETADGNYIHYITSQPIDCGSDAACLSVQFVQVDGTDLNQSMNGTAVANCTRQTLSEVILDGDLIAYEIASPDTAMTALISTACQAWSPGEAGAGEPTVPEGLVAGISYSEVRSQLAEAGWMAKDVRMDNYTSLEQQMYDKGYTEVLGCSGAGQCRFEFDYYLESRLPEGEALVVITRFSGNDPFFEDDPVLDSVSIQGSFANDL